MSDEERVSDAEGSGESTSPAAMGLGRKLLYVAIVAAIGGAIYWRFGESLTLEALAGREEQLNRFQQENLALTLAGAFAVYVAVTALSLPGATVMTLLYGWFFGFWTALVLVSFASTAGATLAFLLGRYLLRDAILRKFGDRLAPFNAALDREGAFYLFTLRLIPAVPFFVINVVMGLTPIRARTFWWVSQLGMIPGTCVYVLVGTKFPGPQQIVEGGAGGILGQFWQLFLAFALLGLFPLVAKKAVTAFRGKNKPDDSAE